jgi:hypothetical protein
MDLIKLVVCLSKLFLRGLVVAALQESLMLEEELLALIGCHCAKFPPELIYQLQAFANSQAVTIYSLYTIYSSPPLPFTSSSIPSLLSPSTLPPFYSLVRQ